ncbi:hypothetical protein RCO28_26245 [Streptomyces sp. LHD-70]|uniref:hypothetical protein n=1 Tax=Streptomyces sp. LHD-70 TaxID=3072140 RepID=UPI00280DCFD6|nr:hypothetical protein [Streptomyces sp. LHD-70]MDQ8705960.1 hypothetical protein [Streptomyces sp. LHD-70]
MSLAAARRRRSAVTLLLGALLALLTVGLVCGPASASAGQATESVRAAAPSAAAPSASALDGKTGCGKKQTDEGSQPAAPSRTTVHEQLASTLSYEQSGTGDWTACGPLAGVAPDRGPPPRDPPSPVELSVLRV